MNTKKYIIVGYGNIGKAVRDVAEDEHNHDFELVLRCIGITKNQ